MMHVLPQLKTSGNEYEEVNKNSLICNICDNRDIQDSNDIRTFPNKEALFQHIRAKHSSTDHIDVGADAKQNFTLKEPIISDLSSEKFQCPACDLKFDSNSELLDHIDEGISPPAIIMIQCENCLKYFQNQRGLIQHMLCCKTK